MSDQIPAPASGVAAASAAESPETKPSSERPEGRSVLREITESSALVIVLAIIASLLISGVLILLADTEFREALPYFFSRPSDTFAAIADALGGAYSALWQGAFFNAGGSSFTAKTTSDWFTQGGTTSIFFLPASRRKSESLSVWAMSRVIEAA